MTNLTCEIPHSDVFLCLAALGGVTLTMLFLLAVVGGVEAVKRWFRA